MNQDNANGVTGKRLRLLRAGSLLTLAAVAFGASSAYATDETADVTATIIAPIVITETTSLAFGSIAADPSGTGTLALTAPSTVVCTTVDCVGGSEAFAQFDMTGAVSQAVTITLPAGNIQIDDAANNMQVNTFNHDAGGSPAFDGSGDLSVKVGGTLNVGIAQAAGSYSGTYTFTVEYP